MGWSFWLPENESAPPMASASIPDPHGMEELIERSSLFYADLARDLQDPEFAAEFDRVRADIAAKNFTAVARWMTSVSTRRAAKRAADGAA